MTYTNTTGAAKTIAAGLVFGRISATNLALPLKSDASDGSQFPVGVLMNESIVIAIAGTVTITVCITGKVNEDELIFENGTDTLATAISSRTLRDRLASDTAGIILVSEIQLTKSDNQ